MTDAERLAAVKCALGLGVEREEVVAGEKVRVVEDCDVDLLGAIVDLEYGDDPKGPILRTLKRVHSRLIEARRLLLEDGRHPG